MGDGKALQMGTSHELGQRFSRAFNISYSSAEGSTELCWTTSWGASTRMMGGLIMCHGDDNGLRVPPRLAPTQVQVTVVKEGDGFNAAYIAARLTGHGPLEAAAAAHRLAGQVIRHRGALMPRAAAAMH